MPRPPNPKSKTSHQYSMKIRQEWEIEFNAMKEICSRNGLALNQEIYERAVRPFLRDHNWPPGNSQTQLPSFGVQTRITQQCEYPRCQEIALYEVVPNSLYAKPKVFYCQKHYEDAKEKRLLRFSKRL